MKKLNFVALVVAAYLIVSAPAVRAVVVPGSTFTCDVYASTGGGLGSTNSAYFLITPDLTATFGTTQTFSNSTYDGGPVTVTSSEVVGLTTVTDTFTISTPGDFINSGDTYHGSTVNYLQFDLGDTNSGSNLPGGSQPVRYVPGAYGPYGFAGSVTDSAGSSSTSAYYALAGQDNLLEADVVFPDAGGDITQLGVNSFTFDFTYANIPDPSTTGMLAAGLLGAVAASRRVRSAFTSCSS